MDEIGTIPSRPGFIDRMRNLIAGVFGLPGLDGAPEAALTRPGPPRVPGPGPA